MKKLLTILCLVLLSSYSYSDEILRDQLVERQGVYYEVNSTIPFTGLRESFHENGQLRSKIMYKHGVFEGSWEWFYPNGQIEQKGMFKNGKSEGRWEFYHENGQYKWIYHNYKNGKEDGLFESFFENGVLETRGHWKEGKKIGSWEDYYEDGKVKETTFWVNGELRK